MGIKYLWIDALCIMQNDPVEVEVEMAAMAEIYQNAQVSISASASTNLHGGCFQELDSPLHLAFSVNGPGAVTKQKAYVRSRPRYGEHVLRPPLTTRGWTLQEDLIPLRTLYCAADQIYWQCLERTITEDGVIDRAPDVTVGVADHKDQLYDDYGGRAYAQHYARKLKGRTGRLRGSFIHADHPSGRIASDLELWLRIINDLTARTLKYPEDRLRAVAGLISDKSGGDTDNVAGLWREDLRFGLWWRAHPSSRDLDLPAIGIPSWSWISFNGRVEYERNIGRFLVWGHFDVVDVTMKWSGQPLTSTLEEATLELNSFLQRLSIDVSQPGHAVNITRSSEVDTGFRATVSSCTGESVKLFSDADWENEENGHAELDRILNEDISIIYAMDLCSFSYSRWDWDESEEPEYFTFILLLPTGRKENEYRRIGLGRVGPSLGLFDGVSKRRITLV